MTALIPCDHRFCVCVIFSISSVSYIFDDSFLLTAKQEYIDLEASKVHFSYQDARPERKCWRHMSVFHCDTCPWRPKVGRYRTKLSRQRQITLANVFRGLLRLAVISFRHESLEGHLLPLYRILLHLFFLLRPTSWPDVSCCCLPFRMATGPLVGARAAQWGIAPFFRRSMISRPVKGEKKGSRSGRK